MQYSSFYLVFSSPCTKLIDKFIIFFMVNLCATLSEMVNLQSNSSYTDNDMISYFNFTVEQHNGVQFP